MRVLVTGAGSRLGRAVSMSEVESAEVYEYQAGIDAALGL